MSPVWMPYLPHRQKPVNFNRVNASCYNIYSRPKNRRQDDGNTINVMLEQLKRYFLGKKCMHAVS